MILVGYTHEIPEELSTTLLAFPHVLAFVGGDETAYFRFLEAWWVSTEPDMVVVEHDIGVQPEGIRDLLNCPHWWCAAMYPFEGSEIYGLGLTKFSLAIRAATPDAFEKVGQMEEPARGHCKGHWCSCDAWLQGVLGDAGHTPHLHPRVSGGVRHANARRSHVACR